jgi:hypothetical protein
MSSSDNPKSGIDPARSGVALAWGMLLLLGVAGWSACAIFMDPVPVWRGLLVNFVFFTPLSAALVVWASAVMLSRGNWLGPLERVAMSGIAVAPLSLAAFVALWAGRSHWAASMLSGDSHNLAWLNAPFLFARDGVALVIWWSFALCFALSLRKGRPKVLAGWVAFLYAVVFSLIGFDMVMALDPHWSSSLFGGYFFVSGMYAAIAFLTFVAVWQPDKSPERLHDLGKLVVAFSIMTTYMMFSQLLPIWYENLPAEIRFLVPRMNFAPWSMVSVGLLPVVYFGPLVLLLPIRAKRTPWYLGMICLVVVCGLWIERWWLVSPALGLDTTLGAADVSACAAFAGALGLGVCVMKQGPRQELDCSGGSQGNARK